MATQPQFSLRTLLVCVTCLAVLLALAQWLFITSVLHVAMLMLLVGATRGKALRPVFVGLAAFGMLTTMILHGVPGSFEDEEVWLGVQLTLEIALYFDVLVVAIYMTLRENSLVGQWIAMFYLPIGCLIGAMIIWASSTTWP